LEEAMDLSQDYTINNQCIEKDKLRIAVQQMKFGKGL
jgi:hypothetical protein